MADEELVAVATFINEMDAEMAAATLRAAGIDVAIRRDDCGGMRPALALSGVEVVVRAEDAKRAEDLLRPLPTRAHRPRRRRS